MCQSLAGLEINVSKTYIWLMDLAVPTLQPVLLLAVHWLAP